MVKDVCVCPSARSQRPDAASALVYLGSCELSAPAATRVVTHLRAGLAQRLRPVPGSQNHPERSQNSFPEIAPIHWHLLPLLLPHPAGCSAPQPSAPCRVIPGMCHPRGAQPAGLGMGLQHGARRCREEMQEFLLPRSSRELCRGTGMGMGPAPWRQAWDARGERQCCRTSHCSGRWGRQEGRRLGGAEGCTWGSCIPSVKRCSPASEPDLSLLPQSLFQWAPSPRRAPRGGHRTPLGGVRVSPGGGCEAVPGAAVE